MSTEKPYLLWIVDAQNDFFDEVYEVYDWTTHKRRLQKPSLSVPDSITIRLNLAILRNHASKKPDWLISGSLDTHTERDVKHFSRWPIHCLKGYMLVIFPLRKWMAVNGMNSKSPSLK